MHSIQYLNNTLNSAVLKQINKNVYRVQIIKKNQTIVACFSLLFSLGNR